MVVIGSFQKARWKMDLWLTGWTPQPWLCRIAPCLIILQLTLPLPPLVWWPWESAARRWTTWEATDPCCGSRTDPADLRRLCLWPSWPPLADEVDGLEGLPMPILSAISSKSSSDRRSFSWKRSLMKNSFEGSFGSVSLCLCPSSIQYPCTRCRIMLAQAFSKSCWLRTFSSSSWCSSPCSSWCSPSSNSLMILSAEKH